MEVPARRPYVPPSRNRLIFRGLVIAFALFMVSGIWTHWLPVLVAWAFVVLGLGEKSMPTRMAGMALAVLVTQNWPTPSIVAIATPEEIATNILFDRTMIVGGIGGAVVHWIAGAVRPVLRPAEEPIKGWPPPQD